MDGKGDGVTAPSGRPFKGRPDRSPTPGGGARGVSPVPSSKPQNTPLIRILTSSRKKANRDLFLSAGRSGAKRKMDSGPIQANSQTRPVGIVAPTGATAATSNVSRGYSSDNISNRPIKKARVRFVVKECRIKGDERDSDPELVDLADRIEKGLNLGPSNSNPHSTPPSPRPQLDM
jgi:hypothetical protein